MGQARPSQPALRGPTPDHAHFHIGEHGGPHACDREDAEVLQGVDPYAPRSTISAGTNAYGDRHTTTLV